MKDGLFFENGELIYYKDGYPYHAGVIKVDGAIYYISTNGRAIKGQHIVHRQMGNDILKRGTYTFGDDYKLVKGSYIAPKKRKTKRNKIHKSSRRIRFSWKKLLPICIVSVLVLVFAIALFSMESWIHTPPNPSVGEQESTAPDAKVTLPEFKEDVLLCSTYAKLEFDRQLALKDSVQTGNPYLPFLFEYHFSDSSGMLFLSEHPDMKDAKTYHLPQDKSYIAIDNLKTGTAYYYQVVVDGQEYPGSFRTAVSTRFVSIPGLVNTRDIGGYVNQDGCTVKQGLLIRGVEIDGLVNASYFIPNGDIESVLDTFGFVYEMDLRYPGIYTGQYSSRLGIGHKFYSAPAYGEIFNIALHDSLRQIFSDLADPQKYPMYMHCTWGADRTGTIIFLLQGILNISEEDMIREYELTGYTDPYIVGNGNMDVIISGLEPYEGNTLQEKIVTYLTAVIGITDSEIESIRNIFLED